MPGRNFRQTGAPAEQRHGLLGPAVDRVHQLEIANPEIVLRLRLDVDLFDGGGRDVTARLGERHARRLVGQHVDGVLRRSGGALPRRRLELDPIEAIAIRSEGGRQ